MSPMYIITHPWGSNKVWLDVNLVKLHQRRPRWLAWQAKLWWLYSGSGRAFYFSNTILQVSIPFNTPMSKCWKHYEPLFATSTRRYAKRTLSFCMIILSHMWHTESRTSLGVLVKKFFSGFGTESFLSHSLAKEITWWRCAGQKRGQFVVPSTTNWVFQNRHARFCQMLV